jgi:hypothetical protein
MAQSLHLLRRIVDQHAFKQDVLFMFFSKQDETGGYRFATRSIFFHQMKNGPGIIQKIGLGDPAAWPIYRDTL